MTESTCPGCGLRLPARPDATYTGYYHTSPECWDLYTEVLGKEFGDAVLFGRAHQLTVDAYAVQHAGGAHPDKSIDVHLTGLHLVLERGVAPPEVGPRLQRLATSVGGAWPHFPPPPTPREFTVWDVADGDTPLEHVERTREWATSVWNAWSEHHAAVAAFVRRQLGGA